MNTGPTISSITSTASTTNQPMSRLVAVALVVFVVTAVIARDSRAEARRPVRFTVSTGFDFTKGEYETDDTTKLLYVPFGLKLDWKSAALKVTLPYLNVSGKGVDIDRPGVNANANGLGDIVMRASYAYIPWNRWLPIVELGGKVKFATANASEGLGTGANDYALQVDLFHSIADFAPFFSVGYRFVGDSDEFPDLDDTWFTSLGVGYRISRDVSAGFSYDWRQSAAPGYGDIHELAPYASFRFLEHYRAGPYLVIGLSENSPDIGIGTQISVSF